MDKLWHILTQTYLPFIVKFVENIYMILKNIMVKVKNVFFSRLHQYPEEPSFFMRYYPMVRSIIDCLSQRFSKNVFHRSEVPDMSVDELQLWNCFSYYPAVTHFDFLGGQRGTFFGKNKQEYPGNYLFTVDWGHPDTNILDVDHSEIPQEHKCAHILELSNGNYAAQPNNRILWNIPSYTTEVNKPDYKVQTTYWNVENKDWKTDNTSDMFYDIKE
jgi:hypothetical protein